MNKLFIFLCFVLSLSIIAQDFPESMHPYENDCKTSESYSIPGAVALEITFNQLTEVEEDADYIVLIDSNGEEVGEYTGKQLAGLTVRIEGDTFIIQLKADDTKNAYGYKVNSVRALYEGYRCYTSIDSIDYDRISNLYEDDLKAELYNLVKGHTSLGYTGARKKMFGEFDNEGGKIRCVYTGKYVNSYGVPNSNVMNTEHTWPKSKGAGSEPAKSDLYHLFPTDSNANSRRSSYPFGITTTTKWSEGGSILGSNSTQGTCFYPRADHRGNVARAMFYFAIRYQKSIDAAQERTLREWHKADPVDAKERARHEAIVALQKKRNPFIDHPEYVDQISDF
ncbi:MAG: endonuclease [Planctomycetes bacterium]|jgi:endonuclease I|nr:endonuclease [Planctomycetota bacterium]HPY74185.1 endonuclease [Planctomycetota bacterium]HQA99799.1 endonuclease [Planctomycetota bacterium]